MKSIFGLLLLMSVSAHAGVEPAKTTTQITGGSISISSVTAINIFDTITFGVSVSAGAGFTVFSSTGTLLQCAVNPPTAETKFSFDIFTDDADEFAVIGISSVYGKLSLAAHRFLLGNYKAQITDSTTDGTYRVRCVVQR